MGKKWYTSKTFWVNAIASVIGTLAYVAGKEFITSNPSLMAAVVAAQGALNVLLRFVTWKPIEI